ncbi:Protein EMSY, partial [Stegodyphus mimosarum]
MWPMHVDYTDVECRRVLRSIELEAYASVVDAFRAQGALTEERKKLLQDLCVALSIPIERHKAEMRRAANDEHLNTIAERFSGPNTAAEWSAEGRQLVPLMSRCPPQTIFTAIADAAARTQAAKNATLPLPGKTGIRQTQSGAETMISRKRKKSLSDVAGPSSKTDLMEKPHFSGLFPSESASSVVSERKQVSVSHSCENSSVAKAHTQVSSCVKSTSSETSSTVNALPNKSAPKQTELKTSTVTTFSSFDQLRSNFSPSRPTSLYRTSAPLKKVSTICEDIRNAYELKTKPRPPPPISSLKPLSFITSASTSCSTSVTIGHVPLASCSAPSSNKKVFTRIKLKNPIRRKQNVPTTLDLKLSPQPQVSQGPLFPKPPKLDVKQESGLFATKSTSSVSLSLNLTESQTLKFPSSSVSEALAVSKSPAAMSKSITETKYSTVSSEQSCAKPATIKKTFPKTSFQGSECSPRPFFSSTAKSGLKSLPPVIFNVPSTLSTPVHTSKVIESGQNESGKSVTQSTALGIGCSHLNLNTAHTQTIQYWNEGGVIRRARIVNISQPSGSCLSRAISPSAVSALGLCPNFTSTALRVTLPAGTLSTSSSMRVSTAAKPNVILVHKVKTSAVQGQEKTAVSQKELSGPSTDKLASKPVDRATPTSPSVSVANLKVPETNIVTNINIPVKESPEIVVSTSEDSSGERKIKIEVQASKD